MNEIWAYWCWPMVASRAWLDFWFAPVAAIVTLAPVAPAHPATHAAVHPGVPDEPPCTDHELFA